MRIVIGAEQINQGRDALIELDVIQHFRIMSLWIKSCNQMPAYGKPDCLKRCPSNTLTQYFMGSSITQSVDQADRNAFSSCVLNGSEQAGEGRVSIVLQERFSGPAYKRPMVP